MKTSFKYILAFAMFASLTFLMGACGGNEDAARGLSLIEASGCQTCHKMEGALIGPSYADVAKRYADGGEELVKNLTRSIINGGSGNWGEVPMTPHPQISEADAETMVRYILSL